MKRINEDIFFKILYFIIVFPLIGENIISIIFGDSISKLLCFTSCLLIFIEIFRTKKIKINVFLLIMIFIILQKTITTFIIAPYKEIPINNVNNIIVPYGMIAYFSLFLLIENNFDNKHKLLLLFESISKILTISVLLNLFFTADLSLANNIQTFKEAQATGYTMSRSWLFGHRNMIFIHHLMWMLSYYIYYRLANKNFKKIFIMQFLYTLIVGIISWNSTMIIVTLLIFIAYILENSIFNIFNIFHYLLFYFLLEFGIVFFRVQDLFSYLIVEILHRNLTFTGRTVIWDYYINQYMNGGILNLLFGNFGYNTLGINSHNMFLGILSYSGLIGLFLYFVLVILSAIQLKKFKNTDSAKFISIIIFGFLINALTMEFYLQPLLAIYFGYSIKKINNIYEL